MSRQPRPEVVNLNVSTDANVPEEIKAYARDKVLAVLPHTDLPVLDVAVRLTQQGDPAVERPCRVNVSLDLNGRPVSVHAEAPTWTESVDLAHDRLQSRVGRAAGRARARRRNPKPPPPREQPVAAD